MVLALLVPILRERERERLQALADSEPWLVFELLATPAKESLAQGDELIINCRLRNTSSYALRLPQGLDRSFVLMLAEKNIVTGVQWGFDLEVVPVTTLAARETVSFEVRMRAFAVGTAEAKVAIWHTPLTYSVRSAELFGMSPTTDNRLQSAPFTLAIQPSEGSSLPTFDDFEERQPRRPQQPQPFRVTPSTTRGLPPGL